MRSRLWTALPALLALAGCALPFFVPGGFDEGMPRLYEPLKEGTVVWVDRPERPAAQSQHCRREHVLVQKFEEAFGAHGAKRPEKREDAQVAVTLKVLAWEYNDAGFSGFRDRDHVEISVTLSEPDTKTILQRANVHVASDFRIIGKYVDSLYKER